MSFFKKIGKGLGNIGKAIGKVGKGVFNVGKKVVGTAISVATPALATAAGALLPGPLGNGLAGAVSGVGMGLSNMLNPKQAEKISVLHSDEGIAMVQGAEVRSAALTAGAPAMAAPLVEGVNTGAAIAAAAQIGAPVSGVTAGTTGFGALLQKYFWVPIVCVLGFVALKRK